MHLTEELLKTVLFKQVSQSLMNKNDDNNFHKSSDYSNNGNKHNKNNNDGEDIKILYKAIIMKPQPISSDQSYIFAEALSYLSHLRLTITPSILMIAFVVSITY